MVNRKHPHFHTEDAAAKPAQLVEESREELVKEEVCIINDEAFKPPEGYLHTKEGQRNMADQEEELVQLAIRQSLMEEQARLARAGNEQEQHWDAQESTPSGRSPSEITPTTRHIPQAMVDRMDSDLELALVLSRAQIAEEEKLRRREDEELQRVLELSLQEK